MEIVKEAYNIIKNGNARRICSLRGNYDREREMFTKTNVETDNVFVKALIFQNGGNLSLYFNRKNLTQIFGFLENYSIGKSKIANNFSIQKIVNRKSKIVNNIVDNFVDNFFRNILEYPKNRLLSLSLSLSLSRTEV